jgi:beta-lactamase class A
VLACLLLVCACAPALAAPPGDGPLSQIEAGARGYPRLTTTDRLAVPNTEAVRRAARWAAARPGTVAFAVADSQGGVTGLDTRRRFRSASLTKAMILVAFLRKADAESRAPTAADLRSLGYMIRVSDNASTNYVYRRSGDGALRLLALDAGMRDFRIEGDWANATTTAADQALFFARLRELLPPRYSSLALGTLETVASFHAWGIPQAARPRWRVFFKGGWRPDAIGSLVHQGALLESGGRRLGLAVMTAGNRDENVGHDTIRGIAALVLDGAAATPSAQGRGALVPGQLVPLEVLVRK